MLSLFRFDIINILVLMVALVNLTMGALVFVQKKHDATNRYFFWLILSVSMWGISMFFFRSADRADVALFFVKILYFSAAAIPFSFIYFVLSFGDPDGKFSWWSKYFLPLPFFLFAYLSLVDGLVQMVLFVPLQESIILFDQPLHLAYAIYIVLYFSIGYLILFKKLRNASGTFRLQIIYILIGTILTTAIGVTSNLLLPFFGNFFLNWLGQVGVLAMVISIAYAILEHHLFDTKIILTEIVSLVLIFVLLTELFLAKTFPEAIIKGITLVFVGILLYLLVKSVFKEIEQREDLERTAKDLEIANDHLRELDQQKSEFVSIASHQLRSPLTSIKGYSSMLLEGSYGKLPDKIVEVTDRIFQSSSRLSKIVEDFLNISRIEQGRMVYEFKSVDIKAVLMSLVEDFIPRAEGKKQKLQFFFDENEEYLVTADEGKIRQVLSNVIDNSIKYTKDEGVIEVRLLKDLASGKVIVSVKDNGIGMSQKTIDILFQKFSRADGVQKLYTEGTGLGLYIASEMMKAHHGRIWAESRGEGKGSTFFVELLSEE